MTTSKLCALNACLVVAYLFYLWTDAPQPFYVISAFLSFFCALDAAQSVFGRRFVFGKLVCTQTMLWYALPFSYIGFFDYKYYVLNSVEANELHSTFVVVLVSSFCFSLFRHAKTFVIPDISRERWTTVATLTPMVLIQAFFILTGYWGYTTATGLTKEETPLALEIVGGCAVIIPPACAALLGSYFNPRTRNPSSLVFLAALVAMLVVQMAWWSLEGRRVMTLLLAISGVLFLSFRFDARMTQQRQMLFVALACVAAPALWFAWDAYYTLRLATDATNYTQNFTIFNISEARAQITANDDEAFRNVISRPFWLLMSVSTLLPASDFLWGWNMISQMLLTIPSFLFPGKLETIGPVIETLWAQELNIPLKDYSNSLFLEGYVDFWYFGFGIYLALFSTIFGLLARLAAKVGAVPLFTVSVMTLFLAINIETTPVALFVAIRSWILIFILCLVMRLIGDGIRSK